MTSTTIHRVTPAKEAGPQDRQPLVLVNKAP